MVDENAPLASVGDAQACGAAALDLAAIVHEHHAAVYRYAYRLCGCSAEAEDLAQQTFLIAYQKLAQLRQAERVRSWLLAVVRSCFLKSIRRPKPKTAEDLGCDLNQVAARALPGNLVDRHELEAALAQLNEEFRLVLLMYYFEGLPYHEIARQLEVPIGTVMSRLSRGKSHLRKKLARAEEPRAKRQLAPRTAHAFVPGLAVRATIDL